MPSYKTIPPIKIGDQAPLFSLKNQTGDKISLADYRGQKNVLLIFYPGDNTPGCTQQLCALRDDYSQLKKLNIEIFGINPADKKSHQDFINNYSFPFDLLIDEDRQVAKKYKALKFMFGHESIKRSVVLIDKQGKIIFLKRGLPKNEEIFKVLK